MSFSNRKFNQLLILNLEKIVNIATASLIMDGVGPAVFLQTAAFTSVLSCSDSLRFSHINLLALHTHTEAIFHHISLHQTHL